MMIEVQCQRTLDIKTIFLQLIIKRYWPLLWIQNGPPLWILIIII